MIQEAGILVVFFGVLVSLACLFLASGSGERRKKKLLERVGGLRRRINAGARKGGVGGASDANDAASSSLKRREAASIPFVDVLVKRFLPRREALQRRLAKTGREIPLGLYILLSIACAMAGGGVAAIAGQSAALIAILAAAAGFGLPHLAVSRMIAKHLNRFHEIFPDAIDLIVRGLKSGLPVTESIDAVGREMPDPVGREFRTVFDSVKFGKSLEDALWEAAGRLDTPDFKFFVISLSVQRETGGNLAETLANLSCILRRRRQMKLKVKAMSSEAKASAYILGSLPFLMFAVIYLINPAYESVLFTDPRGNTMLVAGCFILSLGGYVMRRMVRFDI